MSSQIMLDMRYYIYICPSIRGVRKDLASLNPSQVYEPQVYCFFVAQPSAWCRSLLDCVGYNSLKLNKVGVIIRVWNAVTFCCQKVIDLLETSQYMHNST